MSNFFRVFFVLFLFPSISTTFASKSLNDPNSHSKLPKHNPSLTFCRQYKNNTCCTRQDTNKLLELFYPYFTHSSIPCQQITAKVLCYDCNPYVGMSKIVGICPELCDEWLDKCQNDYFKYTSIGTLTPCPQSNDLICSKLSSIIKDGRSLCYKSGYEVNDIPLTCYDGTKNSWNGIRLSGVVSNIFA